MEFYRDEVVPEVGYVRARDLRTGINSPLISLRHSSFAFTRPRTARVYLAGALVVNPLTVISSTFDLLTEPEF